ncbi:MAG: cysteine dioxygenase family protein [Acidimicrobiales bacterium]
MITHVRPRSRAVCSERIPNVRRININALRSIAVNLVPRVKEMGFQPESRERCWDLLASTPDFEAWVIGWPTGGLIELHDHGSSVGAVAVVSGELVETKIVSEGDRLGTRSTTLSAGDTVKLRSHCVHDVVNLGSSPAVSVHVYSPRLKQMTYYELSDGSLDALRTIHY